MNDKIFDNVYIQLRELMCQKSEEGKNTISSLNEVLTHLLSIEIALGVIPNDMDGNELSLFKDKLIKKFLDTDGIKAYKPDVLVENDNDTLWFHEMDEMPYYDRYKKYLRSKNFSEDTISKMEESTKEILSHCANPDQNYIVKRMKKGLVMGDVQSGKTANYLSLINMAADYGYKVIVILAGLTESLRVQTQKRIDEGFVGANSGSINGEIEYSGVGLYEKNGIYAIPLTNINNDFGKKVKSNTNWKANDTNKPIVFVVKKNKSTLTEMKDWLKPTEVDRSNILLIDDEADNASLNTKDKESDPSTINKLIRENFNNFPIATYIGYTATPYANILIDPFDNEDNLDLFPSDFIVQLNDPDNYFGAKKIFKKDSKVICTLNEDEENYLPVKHKMDVDVYPELPNSLKKAFNDFLLVNVLRTLRGHETKHRSFMINVSRFNKVQEKVKYKIEEHLNKIRNIIDQTYKMPLDDFLRDNNMEMLYNQYVLDDFYEKFRNEYNWDIIQKNLKSEIDRIVVTIVNSNNKSEDRFNYDDYKDDGARVIAIGGFVLSRGLTLEGLMISYFSRNSNAYDTMLQMCRWFGYRPDYEDLCRIYMTDISRENFGAVIDATEDLKEQFRRMRARHKKPKDFGLMIKESPDTLETKLLVTSRNKMRNSQEIIHTLNYGGVAVDTSKIYKDFQKNEFNYNLLFDLVTKLKENGILLESKNSRNMFIDVDKYLIADFIKKLNICIQNKKFDQDGLQDYIRNSNDFNKWDIVIATGRENSEKNWYFCGKQLPLVGRSFLENNDEDFIRISGGNNRLAEPGIFNSGLDKDVIERIKDKYKNSGKEPITSDYLNVIDRKPLLVIYPMYLKNDKSKIIDIDANLKTWNDKNTIIQNLSGLNAIIGVAIGFPGIDKGVKVKYRINEIKIKQMQFDLDDTDEEDEENEIQD